jgi:cytochrome c
MWRAWAGCLACTVVMTGQLSAADEKKEAVALVEKAIVFAKANGKEKILAEISRPNGAFDRGEMYVFVYDFEGVVLAHPKNPKLIGKNLLEMPDLDGKLFRKDIINIAKKEGSGWVDYNYKNPVSGQSENKTTFFKAADGQIYCCGVYK